MSVLEVKQRFAQHLAREHQILSRPPELTPHEIRCQRKAAKRRLRELAQLKAIMPDEIDFSLPAAQQTAKAEIESLEQQMRAALGLDAAPEPKKDESISLGQIEFVHPPKTAARKTSGAGEQASETAEKLSALEKEIAGAFKLQPSVPEQIAPKPKPKSCVRRQIEVIIEICRADGTRLPFYHIDSCSSTLEAEINAAKKARKLGLSVLRTIQTEVVERVYAPA
jgi:hypothetical protein